MAASVPVPMAMPRSAWASAAASLTPSPTTATTRPSRLQAAHERDLVRGQRLGDDGGDADLRRGGAGRALAVPGEQHRLDANRRSSATASALVSRTVSATTTTRPRPPVPGQPIPVAPRPSAAASAAQLGRELDPVVGEQQRAADEHVAAVDAAADTEPVERLEPARVRQRTEALLGMPGDRPRDGCADRYSSASGDGEHLVDGPRPSLHDFGDDHLPAW